jgi:hypothetical protein
MKAHVAINVKNATFDMKNPPLNFSLNEIPFSGTVRRVLCWVEQGLAARDEMHTDCCYALQVKTWVSAPDGNKWEVFVVIADNLPEKPAAATSCCAPGCRTPVEAMSGQ